MQYSTSPSFDYMGAYRSGSQFLPSAEARGFLVALL
jgi:hypothetical protein